MFHIKSLELVHWDYWQRIKNIPLDAKIITIAGQNGSGKTTLLDALRTLFGLECSMGRSYKHYARHSGQQTAWIRAVVDNSAVGPQISNRPFRMSGLYEDEVTLFCQIQKNGGDWKRQYLMRSGKVEIEDIQEANDWLGVESYRKRLSHAGLSTAMGKVLALEQGETDKLCEYAPRQLLDLVFQVFGDKEVLDAYDDAKRHQRDTETELQRFETELEGAKTNLEGLRLRVANYHQWESLNKEKRDLQEEILPTLQYHEALQQASATSQSLRNGKRLLKTQEDGLSERRGNLAMQAQSRSEAQQHEAALEAEESQLREKLQHINAKLKPQESLLEQKARLQKLAAEADADVANVADDLEKKEAELSRNKQERDTLSNRIAAELETIAALQGKATLPDPENVRNMRRALNDAGISHSMLPEIVEVTDPKWQGAVEGVLRGYTSVILLDKASDASAAYRVGEKQRYGHFIVPERIHAPVVKDKSLLSVVNFTAAAPAWLIEQLQRIEMVDSVEVGLSFNKSQSDSKSKSQEWITPDAYHGERRGGRSLFVEASRYRFGSAGRTQRLEALQRSLPRLQSQEDQLTITISKLAGEISAFKARLAGVDAAKELSARHAEFEEASHHIQPLRQQRIVVGSRLGEISPLLKSATEQRTVAHLKWEQAKAAIADAESQLRSAEKRLADERKGHFETLTSMRQTWHQLPLNWKRAKHRQQLVAEHENVHQIELRLRSLGNNLARVDWEIDSTVVDQFVRLNALLQGRQAETDERRYQNNRASEATVNARAAYMDRLRFTIKTYSKNIKQLGELAGIEVHTDPVKLENDDIQLSQAGLHVRFKFDGKGPIGMNDGEASGGQQVMKSLILLIGLLKSEDGSGGFVFIDEPFAHLDIRNIQLVGEFLKNTDAQYLMTTPLTHNTDVYDPSELTLITSKKKKDTEWAQPIFVLQRRIEKLKDVRA
ncbi:ATP-binding protein [Undibacterium sp. 5I1]|uniref:ATP-binding protein n=1 Tax=unclassified Undibacterium TaxID=2630295 RepID=UPI002AB38737|nr:MULTISPECIES: ATP-binding protein [unclassified Undibacterium]MDY7536702.1 ATP-binding protein [Undibacterium sp. 5I1]MEB0230253.1 ATP-binding protein [Undibacterium sp. 10I3]MEB0257953.1 ATP-binding protein [Undibacterium sp. 5I1]